MKFINFLIYSSSLFSCRCSRADYRRRFTVKMSLDKAVKDCHKLPRVYIQPSIQISASTVTTNLLSGLSSNAFIIGQAIPLKPETYHYLKNVLRLRSGDYFRAFNEYVGEYLCVFEKGQTTMSSRINVKISNNDIVPIIKYKLKDNHVVSQHQSNLYNDFHVTISLCFVPIKKPRLKQMLESCTEIGIKQFQPVISQNCNQFYNDYDSFKPLLIETIEQSEQFKVPVISDGVDIEDFLNQWKSKHIQNTSNQHKVSSVSVSTATAAAGVAKIVSSNIPPLFICCERLNQIDSLTPASIPTAATAVSLSRSVECALFLQPSTPVTNEGVRSTDTERMESSSSSSSSPFSLPSTVIDITNSSESSGTTSQFTQTLRPAVSVPRHCGLLIGPEGGFTQREILLFQSPVYRDFVHFVSLGSEILRAETAAVYAVSVVKDVIRKYCDLYRNDMINSSDDGFESSSSNIVSSSASMSNSSNNCNSDTLSSNGTCTTASTDTDTQSADVTDTSSGSITPHNKRSRSTFRIRKASST